MNQYKHMSNTFAGLKSSVDLPSMRRSLLRSFTPSNKRHLCRDVTESNIFCSDMVGTDFILGRFREVAQSPKTIRLEVEDLIAGKRHQGLVSEVARLMFSNDREWESIRFLDSFALDEYEAWQGVKETTMRSYEVVMGGGTPGSCKWSEVILWRANIEIPADTSVPSVLGLLKTIKEDKDTVRLSLRGPEGALDSMEDFTSLIDWTSGILTSKLIIELDCGWSNARELRLLNTCIYVLKHPERADFFSKTKMLGSQVPQASARRVQASSSFNNSTFARRQQQVQRSASASARRVHASSSFDNSTSATRMQQQRIPRASRTKSKRLRESSSFGALAAGRNNRIRALQKKNTVCLGTIARDEEQTDHALENEEPPKGASTSCGVETDGDKAPKQRTEESCAVASSGSGSISAEEIIAVATQCTPDAGQSAKPLNAPEPSLNEEEQDCVGLIRATSERKLPKAKRTPTRTKSSEELPQSPPKLERCKSDSLDSFALRRMRSQALQRWQSRQNVSEPSPNQEGQDCVDLRRVASESKLTKEKKTPTRTKSLTPSSEETKPKLRLQNTSTKKSFFNSPTRRSQEDTPTKLLRPDEPPAKMAKCKSDPLIPLQKETQEKKKKSSRRTKTDPQDGEAIMAIVESLKYEAAPPTKLVRCKSDLGKGTQGKKKKSTRRIKSEDRNGEAIVQREIEKGAKLADLLAIKKTLDEIIAEKCDEGGGAIKKALYEIIAEKSDEAAADKFQKEAVIQKEGGPDYDWELGVFRNDQARAA